MVEKVRRNWEIICRRASGEKYELIAANMNITVGVVAGVINRYQRRQKLVKE